MACNVVLLAERANPSSLERETKDARGLIGKRAITEAKGSFLIPMLSAHADRREPPRKLPYRLRQQGAGWKYVPVAPSRFRCTGQSVTPNLDFYMMNVARLGGYLAQATTPRQAPPSYGAASHASQISWKGSPEENQANTFGN